MRQTFADGGDCQVVGELFRSSRPDYIETLYSVTRSRLGLELFWSSRPDYIETGSRTRTFGAVQELFRSSRPDYIETQYLPRPCRCWPHGLFRSSRPDFIETSYRQVLRRVFGRVVPVFQTGLYIEAGTLEKRGGEVLPGGIGPDVLYG